MQGRSSLDRNDILNVDANELTTEEIRHLCRHAVRRCMILLREILGPYTPLTRGKQPGGVAVGADIRWKPDSLDFPEFGASGSYHQSLLRNIYSDEYVFWGYWFQKWGKTGNRVLDSWVRDDGMHPYGSWVTGRSRSGDDISVRPMKDVTIERLRRKVRDSIHELYSSWPLKELLARDADHLVDLLSDFYWVLRKQRGSQFNPSDRRHLNSKLHSVRSIEKVYAVPILESLNAAAKDVISILDANRKPDGGWSRDISAEGVSSNLNTAEVCCGLLEVLQPGELHLLTPAINLLLRNQQDGGYWTTTRLPDPVESHNANVFAAWALLGWPAHGHRETSVAIQRILENIQDVQPPTDLHSIVLYLQSVRTLARAASLGFAGDDALTPIQKHVHFLVDFERSYWKEHANSTSGYDAAFLVASLTLLLLSYWDVGDHDSLFDTRKEISDRICLFVERILPRFVTVYDAEESYEFTHWTHPWLVASLARQPFVDDLHLLVIARGLLDHYVQGKGVLLQECGRFSVWAQAHFLFAVGTVIRRLAATYSRGVE